MAAFGSPLLLLPKMVSTALVEPSRTADYLPNAVARAASTLAALVSLEPALATFSATSGARNC